MAIALALLGLLAAPAVAPAQNGIPAAINYQGRLTDNLGNPVPSGYYVVLFRIWDSPTLTGTGDYLWGRSFPLHVVTNGMFNVLLTDDGTAPGNPTVTSLLQAFDDTQRYLGLTVTENPQGLVDQPVEISPRQQLVSAPFAIHAYSASRADTAGYATNAVNAQYASGAGTSQFSADNGLKVTGDATLSGGLGVSGSTTLGSLGVSGPTTLGSLGVSGSTTLGSLDVSGSTTLRGNVNILSTATTTGGGFVPLGGIIMWSGTTTPAGWALCNGTNVNGFATPDLRGRFVLGSSTNYAIKTTGGEASHTLTIAEMPNHAHNYRADSAKTTLIYDTDNGGNKADDGDSGGYGWEYSATTVQAVGGGAAHTNMPPYYVLAFIMRVQ